MRCMFELTSRMKYLPKYNILVNHTLSISGYDALRKLEVCLYFYHGIDKKNEESMVVLDCPI